MFALELEMARKSLTILVLVVLMLSTTSANAEEKMLDVFAMGEFDRIQYSKTSLYFWAYLLGVEFEIDSQCGKEASSVASLTMHEEFINKRVLKPIITFDAKGIDSIPNVSSGMLKIFSTPATHSLEFNQGRNEAKELLKHSGCGGSDLFAMMNNIYAYFEITGAEPNRRTSPVLSDQFPITGSIVPLSRDFVSGREQTENDLDTLKSFWRPYLMKERETGEWHGPGGEMAFAIGINPIRDPSSKSYGLSLVGGHAPREIIEIAARTNSQDEYSVPFTLAEGSGCVAVRGNPQDAILRIYWGACLDWEKLGDIEVNQTCTNCRLGDKLITNQICGDPKTMNTAEERIGWSKCKRDRVGLVDAVLVEEKRSIYTSMPPHRPKYENPYTGSTNFRYSSLPAIHGTKLAVEYISVPAGVDVASFVVTELLDDVQPTE